MSKSHGVFHEHLDKCQRCRDNPFALCPLGAVLLQQSANAIAEELLPAPVPTPDGAA